MFGYIKRWSSAVSRFVLLKTDAPKWLEVTLQYFTFMWMVAMIVAFLSTTVVFGFAIVKASMLLIARLALGGLVLLLLFRAWRYGTAAGKERS